MTLKHIFIAINCALLAVATLATTKAMAYNPDTKVDVTKPDMQLAAVSGEDEAVEVNNQKQNYNVLSDRTLFIEGRKEPKDPITGVTPTTETEEKFIERTEDFEVVGLSIREAKQLAVMVVRPKKKVSARRSTSRTPSSSRTPSRYTPSSRTPEKSIIVTVGDKIGVDGFVVAKISFDTVILKRGTEELEVSYDSDDAESINRFKMSESYAKVRDQADLRAAKINANKASSAMKAVTSAAKKTGTTAKKKQPTASSKAAADKKKRDAFIASRRKQMEEQMRKRGGSAGGGSSRSGSSQSRGGSRK